MSPFRSSLEVARLKGQRIAQMLHHTPAGTVLWVGPAKISPLGLLEVQFIRGMGLSQEAPNDWECWTGMDTNP